MGWPSSLETGACTSSRNHMATCMYMRWTFHWGSHAFMKGESHKTGQDTGGVERIKRGRQPSPASGLCRYCIFTQCPLVKVVVGLGGTEKTQPGCGICRTGLPSSVLVRNILNKQPPLLLQHVRADRRRVCFLSCFITSSLQRKRRRLGPVLHSVCKLFLSPHKPICSVLFVRDRHLLQLHGPGGGETRLGSEEKQGGPERWGQAVGGVSGEGKAESWEKLNLWTVSRREMEQ